jgi:hypothetical protein
MQDAFEDMAVLISSVANAGELSDELVRVLITRLELVRTQTLDRLSNTRQRQRSHHKTEPRNLHPAVEDFLVRSGREICK